MSKKHPAFAALKNLSQERPRAKPTKKPYDGFDQLDGTHPWQKIMPEGHISYPVRELKNGKVAYFNFALGKEMGLIPDDHIDRLNKTLEEKILETFCIRIINEYDQENNIRFPKDRIKPNKFMATRYLQLQHSNKQGKTSGDGRCIWNGTAVHKGITWDVSSRGTGVTALAPGAVEAETPLKSGNTDFGYGCGLAEIDELYSAAIMAEIFHLNGINTERVLAIVDLGGGIGIGVRASKNLIRPAHFFVHLKQESYDALKRSTDYFILRQIQNKEWSCSFKSNKKYQYMLDWVCEAFARFAAQLERNYVFAWLDWDGDNVLATAGIIDYGSVRQFGLRHDQYRYDDVDRFSTTLNEQRAKARLIVQVFVQMVDFLESKKKAPLTQFKEHDTLKKFDEIFEYERLNQLLYQWGFRQKYRENLLKKNRKQVQEFLANFENLEKQKTCKKMERVADGVNRPAILNMRKFIDLATLRLKEKYSTPLNDAETEEIYSKILSEHALRADSKPSTHIKNKIKELYSQLLEFIESTTNSKNRTLFIDSLRARGLLINAPNRVTGNALLYIVGEIMEQRKKGLKHSELQKIIDNFIRDQVFLPQDNATSTKKPLRTSRSKSLMKKVILLASDHNEDI